MKIYHRIVYKSPEELLEKTIKEIFQSAGYTISDVQPRSTEYDFIAQNSSDCFMVEVKARAGGFLIRAADLLNSKFELLKRTEQSLTKAMLVVADMVDDTTRSFIIEKYKNIELVDISELLYCIRDNDLLRSELISRLDFSTEKIKLKPWNIESPTRMVDKSASLIERLNSHNCGKRGFRGFEEICIDILTYLFEDVLCEIKPQEYSNKEIFRFDAVARIKSGDKSDFWSIVENNYNSRFILFEFKNYKELIGQTQIFTTEKYLYDKALRRVGIVISRNGANENALWAAKGCLRENGKLILNLCDSDLISMLKIKAKGEDPSDYLMKVLEELLLQLEK